MELRGSRHSSITRQPMAPILITRFKRLLYQHSAKPGTVNKKIPLNYCSAFELYGVDFCIISLGNSDHFTLLPYDTKFFTVLSKVGCIHTCINMKGIGIG